jgi:hypothetical protein
LTVAGSVPDRKPLISLDAADPPTARLLQNQQSIGLSLFKPAHHPHCANRNTGAVHPCSGIYISSSRAGHENISLLYKRFIPLLARSLR